MAQTSTKKTGEKAGGSNTEKSAQRTLGELVPQPHGGAIYQGPPANPVAGPGRPKNEIREQLLELGYESGLPFLRQLFQGTVEVQFVGTCPQCNATSPIPKGAFLDSLLHRAEAAVRRSIDHRLRASEQSWRYGLGEENKITLDHPLFQSEARRYIETVEAVIRSSVGPAVAERMIGEIHAQLGGGQ